jgi:hypothetical protein
LFRWLNRARACVGAEALVCRTMTQRLVSSQGSVTAARIRTVNWTRIERPGPFGATRDQRYAEFDARFGPGNWRIAWEFNDESLEWEGMAAHYEDAYYQFLASTPELVRKLSTTLRDVYEDSVSNVRSGLDYSTQESSRNHITDIVVRRCLRRLGHEFHGSRLLQLAASNPDPLCVALSPGSVPFHRVDVIVRPELSGWWSPKTVESFYQSNKFVEVRRTPR